MQVWRNLAAAPGLGPGGRDPVSVRVTSLVPSAFGEIGETRKVESLVGEIPCRFKSDNADEVITKRLYCLNITQWLSMARWQSLV